MDQMDTDSLLRIFFELDFSDKVRCESVCRKWHKALRIPYAYARTTHLNAAEFLESTTSNYYQQDNINFEPMMCGILRRCGPYLRTVSFGCRWLKISQPIVDHIAEYCGQLVNLDLGCSIINADITPVLESVADKLEEFSLESTSWVNEQDAEKVSAHFGRMKRLRRLNLRASTFTLDSIAQLPPTLEQIDLSGVRRLSPEMLVNFLIAHPQLSDVALCPLPGGLKNCAPPEMLAGLALAIECLGSVENLTTLSIGYIGHDPLWVPLDPLAGLRNLKRLSVRDCFPLNTSALKLILENTTQLESLSITNCAKISNFSSTSYCPVLKELEIEKTVNFCDLDLADIVQNRALTKLRLRSCPNVTSDGIKEVLRKCPLEELELNLCEEIDDKVLEELPLTKARLKSLSLHGCYGVTSAGIKRLVRHKQPRVLSRLAEMDLSRNKNVCNDAIRSLHTALLRLEKSKVKTLTVYVTQTSVSRDVEKELTSRLQVIF